MRTTISIVIVFISLFSAAGFTNEISHKFEESSLNSYLLKTLDKEPNSPKMKEHVTVSKNYGRTVALRLSLSSAIFGVVLGYSFGIYRARRHSKSET